MASWRQQLTVGVRNALVRPGADADYATGDDAVWMAIDWPALTRRVDVDGATLNVVDTGGADKPALVFIHGLSGNWQNWLYNIPAFMDRYRVIAPDLPGFGGSPMPAAEISMPEYARVLDALLAKLEIEQAVVVGNSMGGFTAAELAIRFPRRVARLVLVSAAGIAIEHQRRQPMLAFARLSALAATRQTAEKLERRNRRKLSRRRLTRAAMLAVMRYPEKVSRRVIFEFLSGSDKPGFYPALNAMVGFSVADRLAQIECPTLIVWGANDMLVPTGDAQRFEDLIGANARKVVLDDTGHVPMAERPVVFNRLVEQFLGAPVGAPATTSA